MKEFKKFGKGERTFEDYLNSLAQTYFPGNREKDKRARELFKKEILGLITDEEKKELESYFQDQEREFYKLFDLSLKNPEKFVLVNISEGKMIEASEEDEKTIWTYGLGGCYSCLIFAKKENNSFCILTHYPQSETEEHLKQIEELIKGKPEIITAERKLTLIFSPLLAVTGPISFPKKLEIISNHIKNLFGGSVIEKFYPIEPLEWENYGLLIAKIGKGLSYKTWFEEESFE